MLNEFLFRITMKKGRVTKFVVILAPFIFKPDGCVFEVLAVKLFFRSQYVFIFGIQKSYRIRGRFELYFM